MPDFDPLTYRFPSKRNLIISSRGMVATSHPLAAQIGIRAMQKGGNAVDAVIATAAALTITEPTSNGIGGDCFSLVWNGSRLYGLNSSGTSPRNVSTDTLKNRGLEAIPETGWLPVTVPGAPAGWAALSRRFGSLPFEVLFEDVIRYADTGIPVLPTVGERWQKAYEKYSLLCQGEEFSHWFSLFAPGNKPPAIGSLWHPRYYADTFRKIASSNADDFYTGEIAEAIVRFSERTGGFLTAEDLAGYEPLWVEPISLDYRGYDIWEIPPNGQGLTALIALGLLRDDGTNLCESIRIHRQIEAIKLAFADTTRYIADPDYMNIEPTLFLKESYLDERRAMIGEQSHTPPPGEPEKGGTVYLSAADNNGTMVSFIQSNYMGFGSGLVVPETGIALHNRGCNFSADPRHPNALGPGKRPYHTIIPGFITRNAQPVGPFGVMGGFMQPQGHLQVATNMIDFLMNPQEALDAPRWRWMENRKVMVEKEFARTVLQDLERRGHELELTIDPSPFGRGQVIVQGENGLLWGGTEKRCDGYIAVL
jgi:gamma-glutamyltranspeptidase/glutathione hydrolase